MSVKIKVTKTAPGVQGIGKIVLSPGENKVRAEDWEEVSKSVSIQRQIAAGDLVVETKQAAREEKKSKKKRGKSDEDKVTEKDGD
jgi:hypothetical protein